MAQETRRERTPFSANRSRLQVEPIKGYQQRWFNDVDGRIERATNAGYEFVTAKEAPKVGDKEVHGGNTDVNSRVSRVVGRSKDDKPIRAFLMKIRDEWYQEDMQKKEEVNRRVDEAIRGGKAGGASLENTYGKVNLDTNARA